MKNKNDAVLIIDDSESLRMSTMGLLEARDRACIGLARGEDLEAALREHSDKIRACALDLTLLPGHMTGLETLRRLRSLNPTLPVLVFTGQDESIAKEAYAAGATLFMRKPYETHDLIAAVDALVLTNSLRQSVAATEGEIEILQTALNAMNVEVQIRDAEGTFVIENAPRKRRGVLSNTPQGFAANTNLFWSEQKEEERTVWVHEQEAVSPSGRRLQVTTTVDVSRRKCLDEVRLELLKLARMTRKHIVEFVADCLHDRFGYKRVRFYLGTADEMRGVTSRGMPAGFDMVGATFPIEDPQAKKALVENRPFLLTKEDFKSDPCFEKYFKQYINSQLHIPLISAAGLAGIISVDDGDGEQPLTVEDADLMANLGPMVADAIQVSDELNERKRTEKWWEGLNAIDRPLTEGRPLAEVMEIMGKTLADLVQADAGVVFFRSKPEDLLKVISVINDPDPELWKATDTGTHGIIGQCLETHGQVFVPDIWARTDFLKCFSELADCPWKHFLKKAKSVVVEPIRCGDLLIGVLFLRCAKTISLDDIEKNFLTTIAGRVAIALAKLDDSQRIEATLIHHAKMHDVSLLSAGVAHGMRNPLAIIQSSLDFMRRELMLSPGQLSPELALETITHIETATQRSLSTLDRLIKWAKPHGFNQEWISLKDLVSDLIAMIHDDLEGKRIDFNTSMSETLPLIYAPQDPLRMALMDLFWNAVKSMPDGGTLTVILRKSENSGFVEFSISDTGHGMTEDQLQSLFTSNPFESIPAGGGGLGLYLCKRVLAAQKATITATSELGAGTKVCIQFPAATT